VLRKQFHPSLCSLSARHTHTQITDVFLPPADSVVTSTKPRVVGVHLGVSVTKWLRSRRTEPVCFCAHHKEWRHPVQICCQPKFNYDFICKIDDSYFQGLYEERRVASDSRLYALEPLCARLNCFGSLSC
jgi:hypothetical protein